MSSETGKGEIELRKRRNRRFVCMFVAAKLLGMY